MEEYRVDFINFYDDMFITNTKRLERIAEELNRTGLLKKVSFTCSCSAPNITEDVARTLKEMNVVSVRMGLESGSEKILKELKGPAFSVEKNRQAVEILKKYGIIAHAHFLIGSPHETEQDIKETYNFIKETPVQNVFIWVMTPYPGAAIWDYALERNLVKEDMNWDLLNVNFEVNHEQAITVSEVLTRQEIFHYYKILRKQAAWRNLKNLWRHPFLYRLPMFVYNSLKWRLWKPFLDP